MKAPYVPPQRRNQKPELKKPTSKKCEIIAGKTCLKCGKRSDELNEMKWCHSCESWCEICGKKRAEFGHLSGPKKRCVDCKYLSDVCIVKPRQANLFG